MLEGKGIKVFCLEISSTINSFFIFVRLILLIRKINPDVVQTWMYHSDFFGGLAARFAGVKKIFWGIRHANLDSDLLKKRTKFIIFVLSKLSFFIPFKIIVCSRQGFLSHARYGFSFRKMIIIPNGYDFNLFYPANKKNLRHKIFQIDNNIPILAMIARYDCYKDHSNLISALNIVHKSQVNFHCLLIGSGIDSNNLDLLKLISDTNLLPNISLLGSRSDIPDILRLVDLHILSS